MRGRIGQQHQQARGAVAAPAEGVHGFKQGFVHGLGLVAAAAGLQLVQHLLESVQVAGEVVAAQHEGVGLVAVSHQAKAGVGAAGQASHFVGNGVQGGLELGDFVAHGAGGVDHEHQIQARAGGWRGGAQGDVHRAGLAALEHGFGGGLALAHVHFIQLAGLGVEGVGGDPGAAACVGACPHGGAAAGAHGHLRIRHGLGAYVARAVLHLGAIAEGQVLRKVGVVVHHTGGDGFLRKLQGFATPNTRINKRNGRWRWCWCDRSKFSRLRYWCSRGRQRNGAICTAGPVFGVSAQSSGADAPRQLRRLRARLFVRAHCARAAVGRWGIEQRLGLACLNRLDAQCRTRSGKGISRCGLRPNGRGKRWHIWRRMTAHGGKQECGQGQCD